MNMSAVHVVESYPMAASLSSGYEMPLVGLGTAALGQHSARIVEAGLNLGYRHIDTAFFYGVETGVGEGLRVALAKGYVKGRDEVFITGKLYSSCFRSDLVKPAVQESLKNLGIEYLDLCLVHWPCATKQATLDEIMEKEDGNVKMATHFQTDLENQVILSDVSYLEAWRALEECVQEGLIRSIGLSNFNSVQIQDVIDHARIKPCVNQVECHPYFAQVPLEKFCRDRGILVTAYSPLGGPPCDGNNQFYSTVIPALHDTPVICKIAHKHGKTPAQVALRFNVQRGIAVVPKTSNELRLKENFDIGDFVLSDAEMKDMYSLDKGLRKMTAKGFLKSNQYPFNIAF